MDREVEMQPSRGSSVAWFAMLVMALAYTSGATAQGHRGQSYYESMQDFGPGLEGPMITLIQEKLTQFGYPVSVTGSMNARTVEAIRRYQRDGGMPVTGRADQALANQLNFGPEVRRRPTVAPPRYAPPAPPPTRVAAPPRPANDEGSPQVRWVQERLSAVGYATGAPDGIAGRRTVEAINRFRRDKGMAPGGIDMGLIDALRPA